MKLYPTILTSSVEEFAQQLQFVQKSQVVDVIQIDIIDGYFADNTTIGPLDITQFEFGNLQIDFHLMVEEPLDFLYEIISVKKYLPVRSVIAQVERMSYQDEFIGELRSQGWQVGLSLDLHTPVSAIDSDSWEELDIVQLLGVEAGFQGSEFHKNIVRKIPQIRDKAQKEVEIIIDGGVKQSTLSFLKQEDINSIAVGSGLWTADDPIQAIKEYSRLMN